MKKICKKLICLLLAIALLPIALPASADSAGPMQILCYDVWSGEEANVEAILTEDGYYALPETVAPLCGMSCRRDGRTLIFTGKYITVEAKMRRRDTVTVQGLEFCRLEELLNVLDIAAYTDGGELMYSSPIKNAQMLYDDVQELREDPGSSANVLKDRALPGSAAKGLSNAYDLMRDQRFSAFLDGAGKKDIAALIVSLLQPLDVKAGDPMTSLHIAGGHKTWSYELVNYLGRQKPEGDGLYYALKAVLNGENGTAASLLLGAGETKKLPRLLRSHDASDEGKLFDDYLRLRFNVKNSSSRIGREDAQRLSSPFFSLDDLVDTVEFGIGVAKASRVYADSLDAVLGYTGARPLKWNKLLPGTLRRSAKKVLREYNAAFGELLNAALAEQTWRVDAASRYGFGDALLKKAIYRDGAVWSDLEESGFGALPPGAGIADTVRNMFLYAHLQEFLSQCMDKAIRSTDPADAIICRSAAVLYAKAALNSCNSFSSDTLDELGIPVSQLRTQLEGRLEYIASYPDTMFLVLRTKDIAPGSLRNASGSTTASVFPSAPEPEPVQAPSHSSEPAALYPARPVNHSPEYCMYNGLYPDAVATKDSFYTDADGNLFLDCTADGGDLIIYRVEVAWNATVEDLYGPTLNAEVGTAYRYSDPREFFDYFPRVSEVVMLVRIEGGLVTYIQFMGSGPSMQ